MKCAECSDGILLLKDSRFGKFYGCSNWPACKGSIGAHQKPPYAPLGIPANPETKALRIALHAKLDPLWQGKPKGARGRVYARVSAFIGKPFHTGESDAETCRKVMAWLDGLTL